MFSEDVDESESKNNGVRSIADNDEGKILENPSERITKALEVVLFFPTYFDST